MSVWVKETKLTDTDVSVATIEVPDDFDQQVIMSVDLAVRLLVEAGFEQVGS